MSDQPWNRWGEHPGPCLNYEDQPPEHYDPYDSCALHISAFNRRAADAYSIITTLADGYASFANDFAGCYFCGLGRGLDPKDHELSCVWRRAREFVTSEEVAPRDHGPLAEG